jgi:hypothetical protein
MELLEPAEAQFFKNYIFPSRKGCQPTAVTFCQHHHHWMFAALVAFMTTDFKFNIFIPLCSYIFAYEASCFYNMSVFLLSL